MSEDRSITIPASLILKSDIDNFAVLIYVFLAMTKSASNLNSFSMSHFCKLTNKNENGRIRNILLLALNHLEDDGRIKVLKTSNGFLYEATDNFYGDAKFATVKISEITQILRLGSKSILILRLFLYIKLKMMNGLYYQSFTSLGRLFNQEEKYIRQKCKLLQELGLIGNIRFTTSYKKKNETHFVRFHIFSDMSYKNWEQRARDYGEKLRNNKLKIPYSNSDDDDLW